MQIAEGMIVDLRYYGNHDQVSQVLGEIIGIDQVAIVIKPNDRQAQLFPWTSVQRVIVDIPNDEVS